MRKWSLAQLSVIGVRPHELVEIAARAGYDAFDPIVGLVEIPGIPVVPLRKGAPDTVRMVEAMKANAIALNTADGFVLAEECELDALRRMVELVAELGARTLNTVVFDEDRSRGLANLAALDEMATSAGMRVALEFMMISQIPDAKAALDVIAEIGSKTIGLMVDPLHLCHSGDVPGSMRDYSPTIAAAQLCDAPARISSDDYYRMAMGDRLMPGDGELPLRDFMAALPPDMICSIEAPWLAEPDLLRRAVRGLEAGMAVDGGK